MMMHCSSVQVKSCQSQQFFSFKVQNRKKRMFWLHFLEGINLLAHLTFIIQRKPSLCYLKMVHIKKKIFWEK